jgi:hypothetical protein
MFGDSERDKLQALGAMAVEALEKNFCNRLAARETLAQFISQDARFSGLDATKLAERVDRSRSDGSRVDLTDPRLRGGEARPLARDTYW